MEKKILVTGSSGVLGTALKRELMKREDVQILCPSRNELNLLNFDQTMAYFDQNRPEEIYHLASIVYGLKGNLSNQWEAIHLNTIINDNVFSACKEFLPKKIFFASTVATYPQGAANPLREEDTFLGLPHWGEFGYAFSKRHAYGYLEILKKEFGIDYCYGLFTNIYGPNDRFNAETGHVIPSLIIKAHFAHKSKNHKLMVWGNKKTTRDFIYSEDAARAVVFAMNHLSGKVNISTNVETAIEQVVDEILKSYPGVEPIWCKDEPVGISNRVVDNSILLKKGWQPLVPISLGIKRTIDWLESSSFVRS